MSLHRLLPSSPDERSIECHLHSLRGSTSRVFKSRSRREMFRVLSHFVIFGCNELYAKDILLHFGDCRCLRLITYLYKLRIFVTITAVTIGLRNTQQSIKSETAESIGLLLSISLPNVDQSSKLFHNTFSSKFEKKWSLKIPPLPHFKCVASRYTILCNINVKNYRGLVPETWSSNCCEWQKHAVTCRCRAQKLF